jgi:hypothetical protein
MAERGNTVQINATLPKDLAKVLREEAKKEQRSFSNFIAVLLQEAMAKRKE